jgi:hypothetical protein
VNKGRTGECPKNENKCGQNLNLGPAAKKFFVEMA